MKSDISAEDIADEMGRLAKDVMTMRNVGLALVRIREIGSSPTGSLTIKKKQALVSDLMQSILILLDDLLGSTGSVPDLLLELASGLEHLRHGSNDRILITGELATKFGDGRTSAQRIKQTRADHAALLAYFIDSTLKKVRPASREVARRLGVSDESLRSQYLALKSSRPEAYLDALQSLKDAEKRLGSPASVVNWNVKMLRRLNSRQSSPQKG